MCENKFIVFVGEYKFKRLKIFMLSEYFLLYKIINF